MKKTLLILLFSLASSIAFANDCVISTTRYACPNQEAESYKKCNGAQTCEKLASASNEQSCAALAQTECLNNRYHITKYKSVTAKLNGQPIEGGKDFCDKDNGSYIVNENFPYRLSNDCR